MRTSEALLVLFLEHDWLMTAKMANGIKRLIIMDTKYYRLKISISGQYANISEE